MKPKSKKAMCLVLIWSFILFSMAGCSAIRNILGYATFWNDKAKANLIRGNPDSHYLLACHYQERGRHKEAIEEFNKVLFIDANYVKAYNGLGVSYDLLRDFPKATESYKKALTLNPNLDFVYNNVGYSYLLQGNLDESINAFKKAISLNDQEKRFHNNLGLAYAEKSQFDLALAEFKQAGDEAKAHYNMAQLYFKKGLYDEAKSHYTAALNLNFSSTVVRSALEAANSLARIFQPDTQSAKPEELIILEKPTPQISGEFSRTVEAEAEKPIVQELSSDSGDHPQIEAVNVPAGTIPPGANRLLQNSSDSTKRHAELVSASDRIGSYETLNQPMKQVQGMVQDDKKELFQWPGKDSELEGLTALESANTLPAFYELQVASLRSRQMADLTAGSLRKSGYRTEVRYWKDEKGDGWYRLVAGPFMTKEEAFTCKRRIEKEHRFGAMIVQSKSVKTELEGSVVQNQRSEKSSLNFLRGIEIEISNGNGVNRMAKKVGNYLNEKGLKVIRLTNANNFSHTETKIFYQEGFRQTADYMASQLPVTRKMEELKRFDRPNIKVKLVIGRDLIPHNKLFEVERTAKAVPAPTLTAGR
jgi:tetratricopeptide (TPR) repeat protein